MDGSNLDGMRDTAAASMSARGGVTQEEEDDNSIYYFESDHLALKGNPDYRQLLKAIVLLEAQRVQAIHDLDTLIEQQDSALQDPIAFVDKLQRGCDLNLPKPQKVGKIPPIPWENYTSSVDPSTFSRHKHMTRHKRSAVEGYFSKPESLTEATSSVTPTPSTSEAQSSNFADSSQHPVVVRGRVKDENKPSTFNQLWTAEEQKRLEELLVQFPPEEIEARRFDKIAKALGNRTRQQVASRVQKYFIKLTKAGLPVPGRVPSIQQYPRRGGHRHQRYNKFYFRQSTFLQSYEPPVFMSDDEDDTSCTGSSYDPDMALGVCEELDVSDDESIPPELRDTEEYRELLHLKRMKYQRLGGDTSMVQHHGYKCDRCECEPIVGTRWHCMDCPADGAVDFCDDCVDFSYETTTHNSSHRLEPVRYPKTGPLIDRDYTRFMPGDYNYLDPNYMPAS